MTGLPSTMCTRFLAALIALALTGAHAEAQRIGSEFADFELSDLTQTEATSLTDYAGRALLIEFFSDT